MNLVVQHAWNLNRRGIPRGEGLHTDATKKKESIRFRALGLGLGVKDSIMGMWGTNLNRLNLTGHPNRVRA